MILPIITLLVGVAVVGVSFFILDSHDFKEEDEIYNESSEELKRKITELCDSLLEQSKTSLDEYSEDVRKKTEKELKEQLEKWASKLSEKAKKEMIDYINQSLAEAYEEYNPDAEEKPETVTYEELLEMEVKETEEEIAREKEKQIEKTVSEEKTETEHPEKNEKPEDIEEEPDENSLGALEASETETVISGDAVANGDITETVPEQDVEENAAEDDAEEPKEEAEEAVAEEAVAEKAEEEAAEEKSNVVAFKKAEESAVESETTETAEETTVAEATGTEPVQKPEQPAGGNRSRKKNRKKSRTNRNQNRVQEAKKEAPAPEEIWDDEKNIDEEVAELYKQGFGIMEIANQLGIGVGETKVIIKNIENQKQ